MGFLDSFLIVIIFLSLNSLAEVQIKQSAIDIKKSPTGLISNFIRCVPKEKKTYYFEHF